MTVCVLKKLTECVYILIYVSLNLCLKIVYSFGHFSLEVMRPLSHSKLMALSGYDATDKVL